MFTEIDKILYPNRCEVIEFASQRFVFPIFKNGSSSLRKQAKLDNRKILINQQIKKCESIEIILRDPIDRFNAGIEAFASGIDEKLDPATVRYFVEHYAFLDRHYLPQINWLIWLGTYCSKDALLKLRGMEHLSSLTDLTENKTAQRSDWKINNMSFYLEADQCLYSMVGEDRNLGEILAKIASNRPLYNHVFGHAKRLADVLP